MRFQRARRFLVVVPLLCGAVAATAAPAWASISSTPVAASWGANGRLWTTLRVGDVVSPSPDLLLVEGDFTMIGSAPYNRIAEFQIA